MISIKVYLSRVMGRLTRFFGRGLVVSVGIILLVTLLCIIGAVTFVNATAPTSITIATGPAGSAFQRTAAKYKKILAKQGVTLHILPSEGSIDNLHKLANPKIAVDVGFVMGGESSGVAIENLLTLGSISYQPLMIFYRGESKTLMSDFKGKRLDIGEEGSGTRALALALLKANGLEAKDYNVGDAGAADHVVDALQENRIDAIFIMGESTPTDLMRRLLHAPDIHLYNFIQAEAYVRRFNYLNKLELPRGALDFGKDTPPEELHLIGPTVELVARSGLHPALSDLLLEAAREVHGSPGLFRKRGEFPAALEHEFPLSPDATRYYTSGKSFLYRSFPFWLASLLARALAVVVPIILLLIPALKVAPAIYRWRIESRIYRWYRALLELERDAFKSSINPQRRQDLLRHLDHIEHAVNKITVPAAFGDLFYGLRGHIHFVRERLLADKPSPESATVDHEAEGNGMEA